MAGFVWRSCFDRWYLTFIAKDDEDVSGTEPIVFLSVLLGTSTNL
jgi:hypothetical protein